MFKDEVKKREIDDRSIRKLENSLNQFSLSSMDDLYYALATKALTMHSVFERLEHQKPMDEHEKYEKLMTQTRPTRKTTGDQGVRIAGIDSMMVSMSKCCSPVYGDDIIGYVTKGHGVRVHRKDCPNIMNETSRLIDVSWDEEFEHGEFETVLTILSTDRSFLLTDLVTTASQLKATLNAVNSEVDEDKSHVHTTMRVLVKDSQHLRNLVANLRKVDSVLRVERKIL